MERRRALLAVALLVLSMYAISSIAYSRISSPQLFTYVMTHAPRHMHVRLLEDGRPLTVRRMLEQLQQPATTADTATTLLVDVLIDALRDAPYEAFYFEMPPIAAATLEYPAEFVVVESTSLVAATVDRKPFAAHLDRTADDIVTFLNLGKDARLVVPADRGQGPCYAHLAKFVRGADRNHVRALWRVAATELVAHHLGEEPVWWNTNGDGVYWLHVRLDTWPKYYQHAPYKTYPRLHNDDGCGRMIGDSRVFVLARKCD